MSDISATVTSQPISATVTSSGVSATVASSSSTVSAGGGVGPVGAAGTTGSTGAAGPANTLTIGTVTGGSSAAATLTGTAPAQVLSLVLPRGDTGAAGVAGPQGPTGTAGATGAAGATGPQGPAGSAASATTSASDLTSGTLGDARLSANVVLTGDSRLTDARTPTTHTHPLSSLTQSSATTGQAATWNGTAWAAATPFSGSYTDLTNKPTIPAAVTTLPAASITGLATVATSGSYADLSNKPSIPAAYSLPVATSAVLGGVKQGSNVTISADGTVSVAAPVTTLGAGAITGLATVATSGAYADLSGRPTLFSGSYADLTNTPASFSPAAHNQAWSTITSTPTTLSGYGITDAVGSSDSRLTDSRAPTSHAHGNLTNAGAIGSTTGQVVVTTTSGVLTTAATISASTQVSGLAAVATSGSAADLSGTLDDARLSSAVALHAQLNTTLGQASGVIDTIPRVTASGAVTASAGQALLSFFKPTATVTVSQITMATAGGAVAAGLTLARMGIYTYTEGGTATLVARTASDTTLFAATNTAYTRSLDTTGGYPDTYTLNAGTRYGVGYICVGTTQPQLVGRAIFAGVGGLSPRLSTGTSTGLSDLPTSFTPGTNGQAPFARLS